jgi:hypothetical protein
MRAALAVSILAGCGTFYTGPLPVGAEVHLGTRGRLALPAGCALAPEQIVAELLVGDAEPCAVTTTPAANASAFVFNGSCPAKSGQTTTVTLRVRAAAGQKPVLSEVSGAVNLVMNAQSNVEINFDDEGAPLLKAKTIATSDDPPDVHARFNCDRSGPNLCAQPGTEAALTGDELDTCSNLQELCAGTLLSDNLAKCN